jgi:hypothetical protein
MSKFDGNHRVTSLKISGGQDVNTNEREFPDLYVKGGAIINKKLVAGNIFTKKCITVPFVYTTCINANNKNNGITIEGVLIKNGTIYGNISSPTLLQQPLSFSKNTNEIEHVVKKIKDTGQTIITNGYDRVTINTPFIRDSSQVFLTLVNPKPSGPVVSVGDITPGVSFTVLSDVNAEKEGITINWMIIGSEI